VLLCAQLLPAQRPLDSPLARASLSAPAPIEAILARSCFDCHSAQTVWPWYAQIAPLSWWTAAEVRRGRAALDFSNWRGYSASQQAFLMTNSVSRARAGRMPPSLYAWAHPQVRLTEAELAALSHFAESLGPPEDAPEKGAILAFCREDGELGESLERRLVVNWSQQGYRLWDPETGRRATAANLTEALEACRRLLSSDPTMRLATWERRYRPQWEKVLRSLNSPLLQPPPPTRSPAPSAHPPAGANSAGYGRG